MVDGLGGRMHVGGQQIFVDRRPLFGDAIPGVAQPLVGRFYAHRVSMFPFAVDQIKDLMLQID